jgi:predicted RNase H-like HicB family nuclease
MSTGTTAASAKPQYSMVIKWSTDDGVYLVSLPEWMPLIANQIAVTHGATYEEAARNGQEVIEMLIEEWEANGKPLPAPHVATAI